MATLPSRFALAERAENSCLQQQAQMLLDIELLHKLYSAVNEIILILNRQRQIVFCNTHFAELLGCRKCSEFVGMRPGEALECIHAGEVNGCGTSEFCTMCGNVRAILNAQQGHADIRECRILRGPQGEAMDLLVRTTPLQVKGENFTIFALLDISDEKRRKALERVFFHDLMNTAIAIQILSQNLGGSGLGKISEVSSSICNGVQQLIEEIESQRDLVRAENNELPVRAVDVNSETLLSQILDTYGSFAGARHCKLVIDPQTRNTLFYSDPRIVARILGNMIKNAIEACREGQTVMIASQPTDGGISFSVHNPAYMPHEVQLQLFMRSFSTKGAGRGLGTYGMRLLTERYLKGRISFTSSEIEGTTFTVTIG
jgi:signal transduction histidine kinase